MNKVDLISYASAFVSFMLKSLKDCNVIEIIVFGSVARGDFDENSDIDIFVNIQDDKESPKINKIISSQVEKFYKSKVGEMWQQKGMTQPFKIKAGNLDTWKLKRSIIADGIVLFGKYKSYPKNIDHYCLFMFDPIKNVTKRNRVIRKLFGRKEVQSVSQGLVGTEKRLSPTSFIVPITIADKILDVFRKEKVNYRLYEIWSDQFRK